MKGVWMSQVDAAQSIGISVQKFIRLEKGKLKVKFEKKKKKFFINYNRMNDEFREQYKDDIVEIDDDELPLDREINDNEDQSSELNKAKLDNIIARTRLLNEKIESRKGELFVEWSERFFSIFTEAFAKYKNNLINLHLKEEQLALLNESLEFALKSMKDGLIKINNDYLYEDELNNEEGKI